LHDVLALEVSFFELEASLPLVLVGLDAVVIAFGLTFELDVGGLGDDGELDLLRLRV